MSNELKPFTNKAGVWDFPRRPTRQYVWWFPEWCGLGVLPWGGAAACMFQPSICLGFLEIRRWRSKAETERRFDDLRRQYAEEDAAELVRSA